MKPALNELSGATESFALAFDTNKAARKLGLLTTRRKGLQLPHGSQSPTVLPE
jgi:hypothetical protein